VRRRNQSSLSKCWDFREDLSIHWGWTSNSW